MDNQNNIDEIIKKYRVRSEINEKITEGSEIDIYEIIDKYKIDFTNKDKLLTEGLITEFDWEIVLMGLGFIPVIGEAFDVILIIKYLRERRWLEAFIMMIALIPTVGDMIAKPFLIAGRGLKAFTGTGKFMKVLKENPKFAKMYEKVSKYFTSPKVKALSKQMLKKNPELAGDLAKAERFHINAVGKIKGGSKTVNRFGKTALKKGGIKRVKKTKTGFGFGSQQFFRTKAINKYFAKHGKLPEDGLSAWWNIVYKGRRARKSAFRKALMTSSILGSFGLPSIEAFQDFIATPEGAEAVLNDPEFQDFYSEQTSPEQENDLNQQWNSGSNVNSDQPSEGNFDLSSVLSIPFLKKVASATAV